MNEQQSEYWNLIKNFEIDDVQSAYTFSDRLALENGWTLECALRATEEYKKFIFLICIAEHPLTPSDQVDQVWHLHLLYTRSYWIDFCRNTLQREIHHGPTKGGAQEHNKFVDWYTQTKILYTKTFKQGPPRDIWPEGDERFSDIHFKRVNVKRNWIIKKLFLWK